MFLQVAWMSKKLWAKPAAVEFVQIWTLKCHFNAQCWENDLEHLEQMKGFSPVWVLKYFCQLFLEQMSLCTRGSKMVSFLCELLNDSAIRLSWRTTLYTGSSHMICLQCNLLYVFLSSQSRGRPPCECSSWTWTAIVIKYEFSVQW